MRILNIGSDQTLVGATGIGDAVSRHRAYGSRVESLDIIVYTRRRQGLNEFKISSNVIGHPSNSGSKWSFIFDALRLAARIYRARPFDLVVAQDPFVFGFLGYLLKRRWGCKLQINLHGDFYHDRFWHANPVYRLLAPASRYLLARADAVRVMSQGQKAKLLAWGLKAAKVRVISTPVDIERFVNFESQATTDQKKLLENFRQQFRNKFVILMVGRKDSVKDFDTLAEAVRLLKETKAGERVKLWLVGNYSHSDAPVNLVELITIGEPRLSSEDLPVRYYSSDVLVLSSKSESFGKVLIEANACAKPVIATATTGAKEIVQDGFNGFLVPIGDARALADKLMELMEHPRIREAMGKNGQKLVKERYGGNLEKIVGLWKEIMAKPG